MILPLLQDFDAAYRFCELDFIRFVRFRFSLHRVEITLIQRRSSSFRM